MQNEMIFFLQEHFLGNIFIFSEKMFRLPKHQEIFFGINEVVPEALANYL